MTAPTPGRSTKGVKKRSTKGVLGAGVLVTEPYDLLDVYVEGTIQAAWYENAWPAVPVRTPLTLYTVSKGVTPIDSEREAAGRFCKTGFGRTYADFYWQFINPSGYSKIAFDDTLGSHAGWSQLTGYVAGGWQDSGPTDHDADYGSPSWDAVNSRAYMGFSVFAGWNTPYYCSAITHHYSGNSWVGLVKDTDQPISPKGVAVYGKTGWPSYTSYLIAEWELPELDTDENAAQAGKDGALFWEYDLRVSLQAGEQS